MSVAVVTGAAGGIGGAITHRLLGDGYQVIAVDLSDRLARLDGVEAVEADLTTAAGIDAVLGAVGGRSVDLLVNNAGITRDARLVNLSPEDFEAVIEVNLGASYRLSLAVAPSMGENSAIVSLASRAYLGNFGQFNYSMSKGGLVGMTRALAIRLAPGIRVNAIAPGLIETEMALAIPDEIRAKMISAIPQQRMGRPEEVADLVAFLARPGYITGEVIVIGGGRSLT